MAKKKGTEMVAMSRAQAVRNALSELGASATPADVGKFLRNRYKMDIGDNTLSVYFYNERKKMGTSPASNGKVEPATPVVTGSGREVVIKMVSESPENLNSYLSTVRRLKGVDLNVAESILADIAKTTEIVGDPKKAIDAFCLLKN